MLGIEGGGGRCKWHGMDSNTSNIGSPLLVVVVVAVAGTAVVGISAAAIVIAVVAAAAVSLVD